MEKIDLTIDRDFDYAEKIRTLQILESLKSIDKSSYKIVTFDIETYGLNPENLALAIFFNGVDYKVCFTKEECLDYIDNLQENTLIYAHNGFKYDYNIFYNETINGKFKITNNGNISLIKYKNNKDFNIELRDSLYILPGSLKGLGESFFKNDPNLKEVIEKTKTPTKFINPSEIGFSREEYELDKKAFNIKNINEEDIEYCKNDCFVLYKILMNDEVKSLKFQNFNTIAKIANHKILTYLKNKDKEIIVNNKFDNQFKDLFSGGLTDCFKNEAIGKIETYDFNSMYPKAMSSYFANPMRFETIYFENKTKEVYEERKKDWFNMLENYPNGLSFVTIRLKEETPKNVIDILRKTPLFATYKTNYEDIFDCNEYKMKLMNVELSNILNPLIKDYFEVKPLKSLYCKKENLVYYFKDFIEELYNKRLENKKSNPSLANVLKLIMNSSYGYFAMQNQKGGYMQGNEERIAFQIERHLKENFLEDIKTYKEFQETNYTINEFQEYELPTIFDYVYYLKENLGEYEDFKILNINYFQGSLEENGPKENIYFLNYKGEKSLEESKTSFYIASEITSKSRALLGKVCLEVAFSKNNVCYVDTDSLHIEVLDKQSLEKVLNPYLDDNILGKLKNEGTYDYGVWLAKKHYYLFLKDKKNRLVLVKKALKGFRNEKPIDYFLPSRNIINVNKLISRVKNLKFETNEFSSEKTFLNFVENRDINNNFFKNKYIEQNVKYNEIERIKAYKQNLFYSMYNKVYVPNQEFLKVENLEQLEKELLERNINLIEVNKENLAKRKEELDSYINQNNENLVYQDISTLKIISREVERILVKEYHFKKEKREVKEEILLERRTQKKKNDVKRSTNYKKRQKEMNNKIIKDNLALIYGGSL